MEHHKTDKALPDLNELKEQIALEYGRSLLQLQQFELTLKATLPTLKVSGFSDELARNVERDRQLLGGKTLGHLVSQWRQRSMLEDDEEIDDDALNGRAYFRFSFGLEDGEWMNEKLKQLVGLRNELVHHFLSHFTLNSEASCQEAIRYLAKAAIIIKDNREALHSLLIAAEKAKSELLEFMNSPEGEHFLLSGAFPGESADNWENATITQQPKVGEHSITSSCLTPSTPQKHPRNGKPVRK
ncbi:hypothetical protein OPFLODJI_02210 [Aeromonas hydrophila]|uniref:hypothetical protein n=1 Tax=Aeromonas hydrophila TaxID=644 RepID=UPI00366B4E01